MSIKLFMYIISLLEEVLKKPRSFFRIMVAIKFSFKKRLLMTKCLFEVKTFSSFWIFSVTTEKVGDIGGDGCSVSV